MQNRTVEQVESWESRPFSGGFSTLHDLGDEEFTGAVVAGNAWLFMLNGRVVGVFEGDIDDFEDGTGTVYEAPHESLPLLFSMQERGGETRAKYFTNDTPLQEADRTLQDANFTGYLELSENVLSGDYYVAYYGGQKRSAAFIGQSERVVTGDEAYEKAADEVGIYEVKNVSMNITEIPAPAEPEPEPAGEDSTESGQTPIGIDDPEPSEAASGEPGKETGVASEDMDPGAASADSDPETASADTDPAIEEAESTSDSPAETTAGTSTERHGADAGDGEAERGVDDREPQPASSRDEETGRAPTRDPERAVDRGDTPSTPPDESGESPTEGDEAGSEPAEDDLQAMFREEEEWRQTRSIPALNPDETAGERDETTERRPRRQPAKREQSEPQSQPEPTSATVTEETIEELKSTIEKRERQIDDLADSMESVKDERNDLQAELDSLRTERDDLEERVSNLESALQRAKDEQASIDTTATELTREEALAGTNLFVRYQSKGKPTLDVLEGGGEVQPDAVNENLKLDHHTQFDVDDVVVEGRDFEEFLWETSAYRFVEWLVGTLPYELLESGGRSALADVYAAIPQIDRIEFEGSVEVEAADGGSSTQEFAVVVRDRMGNPLIAAELNDARDPVHGDEMETLIDSAVAVGDVEQSLSGAFYVTASFFEPPALEAAEKAESSGGLFSRSDKRSYVKTQNKSGFHLCLVEDRAESFHMTVPEL